MKEFVPCSRRIGVKIEFSLKGFAFRRTVFKKKGPCGVPCLLGGRSTSEPRHRKEAAKSPLAEGKKSVAATGVEFFGG